MTIDPRSLLSKYGLHAKKYYSQNFLTSAQVVNRMSSFAKGTVLEVGPGLGTLTNELSKRAERVIAIERDPNMIRVLSSEYVWDNVELVQADVLEGDLPTFDVCISSVPYSISSPLLFKLLDSDYERLILLLQSEFAQKLYSSENPSRLSIMSQTLCDVKAIMKVPPKSFFPRPKVNSTVVEIIPDKKFEFDERYPKVVRGLMTHKRKTVRNALMDARESFNKDKVEMKMLAEGAPYSEVRVKELDIYKIKEISDYLSGSI